MKLVLEYTEGQVNVKADEGMTYVTALGMLALAKAKLLADAQKGNKQNGNG